MSKDFEIYYLTLSQRAQGAQTTESQPMTTALAQPTIEPAPATSFVAKISDTHPAASRARNATTPTSTLATTGDAEADAEILAFERARDRLLAQRSN